ncbi:MAG: hypothetical protein LBH54_02065 [Clostridiales bacterium]|jgi:hypothetical protein|nr:hypothetical protein [Clostridiales bacterium]
MLKAGVSIVDISPKKGVGLAGYPHCPRPNKGVHDPLYACCLYLNDGEHDAVIVTLDLLFFGKKYVRRLREKFRKNILFTCSHTHSGPWAAQVLASELSEGIACDEGYIQELLRKLERGIKKALANTFHAAIGTRAGNCGAEQGVGGNRRVQGGLCDPSVNVLAVRDETNEIRAVLVNYALHPTFLHAENTMVSADYPAYIRRFLSFAQPKAVTLFAQGASGDQSSRYHRTGQEFDEAARVGTTIGIAANRCLEKMEFSEDVSLSIQAKEIELPLREYPSIASAEERVKELRRKYHLSKTGDYIETRNAELALFGAENILSYSKLAQAGYTSEELPCEIQMIAIGDTAIVGVQGELFAEYGLAIKNASPYGKTFVFTVTNGALPGYVYTPEAAKQGGYEAGTSMLTENAGSKIIQAVKEMF